MAVLSLKYRQKIPPRKENSAAEFFFVGVYDLRHEHFPADIGVQAVDTETGVQKRMRGIVEIWFQVNIILLLSNKRVDQAHFIIPARIRFRMEGLIDMIGIYGHKSQKNRTYIVGAAFFPYSLKIFDDRDGGKIGA